MEQLVSILGEERAHLFDPGEYTNLFHRVYKIVRQAVQARVESLGFETEPDRVFWQKQGESFQSELDVSQGRIYAETWRAILNRDKEVARYFEIIEDSPSRIICRVVDPGHTDR